MHNTSLVGYDSRMRRLPQDIADLRYDVLRELLRGLAEEMRQDALADLERGRWKLAMCLSNAAVAIEQSQLHIDDAWKVCEPYIKGEGNVRDDFQE